MSSEMDAKEIETLLEQLDGTGAEPEWAAVERLRALGPGLPKRLHERFRSARGWRARSSCVYHAMRYAKESEDAVALGLNAIRDRSKVVRYRGAMLLAYSQRPDVVPHLRSALHAVSEGADDIAAAIDAIEHRNHDFFVDREHSGKVKLSIE